MSIVSTIERGNRTTIPAVIANALGLKAASKLAYHLHDDGTVSLTSKSSTFSRLAGTFPKKPRTKPVTDDEIQAAVRQGAVRRFKRAKS